jgi:hypothetical protein
MRLSADTTRHRVTLVALLMLASGVALALLLPGPISGTPVPSVFVAPDGNDANPCTRTAPCGTPNRAYHVASCSSVVQIAAGNYESVNPILDYDPNKESCSTHVTFIPAGNVVFGAAYMSGAKHWKFDATSGGSFSFGEVAIAWQASNTDLPVIDGTFDGGPARNIHMRGVSSATVDPQPKQQFTVLNSEIGPNLGTTEDLIHLRNVRDTIFKGNFIHDLTKPSSDSHSDCIQNMGSSVNLSFVRNIFVNCWSDAFIEKSDFGPDINIQFNNNEIRHPINGDGTTPFAVGYFGAGYGGGRVTGEIKDNCVLATSHNIIVADHTTVNAGRQSVTESGDNVAISGNVYGNCAIPLLPNLNVTPGALYPLVHQSTIAETICKRGWTAKIKPSAAEVSRLKARQIAVYGSTGPPTDYVLDHLVPLGLGGAPRSVKNLWPEPRGQAKTSNAREARLKRSVCRRTMTLAKAQTAIRAFKFVRG